MGWSGDWYLKWKTCGHTYILTLYFTQWKHTCKYTCILIGIISILIHTHICISLTLAHLHYIFSQLWTHLDNCTPTNTDSQTILTCICDLVIFMIQSSLYFLHDLVNFILQCKSWTLAKAIWLKSRGMNIIKSFNHWIHVCSIRCNLHLFFLVSVKMFATNEESTNKWKSQFKYRAK